MKGQVNASAPGSLMLLGEHAVLHGKLALVTAVTRRITVTLTPRTDTRVCLSSDLGHYETDLGAFRVAAPFPFVLRAIEQHRERLESGFDLRVESSFSDSVGLGSSAAVTVATHAALMAGQDVPVVAEDLFERSLLTVRTVQGMGSGADIAAGVWGGTVAYRAEPRSVHRLKATCPLTVVYSGTKKPTPEVVALVDAARQRNPRVYEALFALMDETAQQAVGAVEDEEWARLGELLNINHGLMEALGVGNAVLAEIVHALRADPAVYGAKISGSGLGDCVIGLGHAERRDLPYEVLDVDSSPEGVRVD